MCWQVWPGGFRLADSQSSHRFSECDPISTDRSKCHILQQLKVDESIVGWVARKNLFRHRSQCQNDLKISNESFPGFQRLDVQNTHENTPSVWSHVGPGPPLSVHGATRSDAYRNFDYQHILGRSCGRPGWGFARSIRRRIFWVKQDLFKTMSWFTIHQVL